MNKWKRNRRRREEERRKKRRRKVLEEYEKMYHTKDKKRGVVHTSSYIICGPSQGDHQPGKWKLA